MNNEDQREPLSERLDRFENEFKAGKTPKLEEYVSCDSDILEIIEFIHIDLEQRFRKGQRPEVKDYISKYPELQNHPNEILELLKREIYLLSENGERVGPEYHAITETVEYFDLEKGGNKGLEYYLKTYEPLAKELKMYFRKQGYSLPEINGFSVLEKIGQGGMGEVYKARQISLSRDVAIKIVRYDKIKDLNNAEEYRRRFQKEGQTLASINHVNVVKIYDAVKYEENLHLVMEYLEGESLQKRIQNEGNLSPQKAAEIVEKIARGLSEVHKKGVIHRDLKPDNIFLTLDGEPKVLDFGLARSIENADGRTQEWVFNGTPQYSSPEQSSKNGGEISFQTDVYGLGAILYSCLTGIAPFPKSGDFLEILNMVRQQEVVPILALRPNCPKDLETICLKCLRKDPKHRYSSALEFAEDLRRFQSGMPIMARPVGSIEKLSKWVARNPVVSAAIAVAVITLISGTIISSLSALYAKEQAQIALSRTIEIEDKNKLLEISATEIKEKNRLLELSEKEAKKNEELARASQIESQNEAKKAQKNLEIAVLQKKKADFQLYVNKIQRAENEINFGNSAVALNQLISIPFPQRGWEHDYLYTLLTKNQATLKGHTSRVTSACFSSNGKKILSSSDDTTLKLWDSSTGLELQSFNGHSSFVASACLSPDGEMALSGSFDNTVKIWDCSTGKVLLTFKGHNERVRSVCFSPDGKRVVSGDMDETLKIWNAKTGKEIFTLKGHKYGIFSVNFSPDGMKIISGGGDNILRVWNSYTGDEIQTIKGHKGIIFSVCFSPDGKKILSGSNDHTLRIWNSNTGDEIQSLKGHRGPVLGVCYSPDGNRIASSSFDNTVKVWDCTTNQEMLTLKGHLLEVKSVCFSPDGKKIVTGSHDKTLKLWDSSKDQNIYSFKKHFDSILSVCYSPDGKKFLSSSSDKTIKIFDSANNQEILCLSGHAEAVSSICFSPDGKRIVSGSYDKTLKIWDSLTGNEVFSINGHQGSILSVCWSPDGRHIASAGADNTVKVWNSLNGREAFTLKGHTGVVSSVCFSPDNSRVLSGSWDRTVKIWDCSTGKEIFTLKGHTLHVSMVCFSPCGTKVLSGSHDYTLKLWDNYKGVLIHTLRGHTNFVRSCCFSPDGKRIISGSLDNTFKVWDSTEGLEIVSTKARHTNGINSICYNPDGKILVSGGLDSSINVWYGFNSKDRLEQDNAFLASLAKPDPKWHIQNAEDSEKNKQYFVAAFHLRKLIEIEPNNETAKKRLEFIENKLKENK